MKVSCIVLVGGKCRRLGRDKALEIVGNKSLLERVLSTLSLISDEIILVAAKGFDSLNLASHPQVRKTTDIYFGKGPLGGIYSGLAHSRTLYNLVVACDMPFLSQLLLQYMIGLADGYDLVVPRLGNLVEPLHAIYSKRCLEPAENLLKEGKLSVSGLFSLVKVRYVEADEIDRFDPQHISFFNVNTKADLEKAKELAGF